MRIYKDVLSDAYGNEPRIEVFRHELCSCEVDARFDQDGEQRTLNREVLEEQKNTCYARAQAKSDLPKLPSNW